MYEENQGPIDSLVHLYVDGAFSRRELVRRVAKHTGSVATAMVALKGYDVFGQAASACPANVRVPADAPDLVVRQVEYTGEGTPLYGQLSYPRNAGDTLLPGVLVIHENQGLVEHIKDVGRRAARAGFISLAPDLLSRVGGVDQYPDAAARTAAYARTTPSQRQADLISSLSYLKAQPNVIYDRIGTVGFCAGGANVWNLSVVLPELRAAVPFYGAPPPVDMLDRIQARVLAIYAETDRNLTMQMAATMTALLQRQKPFGAVVYEGVGHAFHNDTGPNYNAEAACDAWTRTIAWFNKYLRA
jgi:carboxymethylenebutenolidase